MKFAPSLLAVLICLISSPALAQNADADLLKAFDASRSVLKGDWEKNNNELRSKSQGGALCLLARDVGSAYRLTAEFTRLSGDDVVAFILPLGGVSVALELSSWQGEAHGIAGIDGQTSKSENNPTSVRPGQMTNGRRFRVDVRVSKQGDQPAIDVQLDGKKLITWTGASSRLQSHRAFKLAEANSVGLALGKCEVVFHDVRLTRADTGTPAATPPAATAAARKSIDLKALAAAPTPGWEPFNGGRFTASLEGAKTVLTAVPDAGSDDRGAYVSGLEFTDGIIEVDLKGADRRGQSFLGVVFHGVDGKTYDGVYFRPFNFRAADPVKRSHAVQYVSHPQWTWDRLRRERDGEFEKAAAPAPTADQWFHARIVITGSRVRVFVDGSSNPCLDIQKLSNRRSGKVGLWFNGIASFAELSVTSTAVNGD